MTAGKYERTELVKARLRHSHCVNKVGRMERKLLEAIREQQELAAQIEALEAADGV